MDKYKNGAKKRFKPTMDQRTGEYKRNPFEEAQGSLSRAIFSKKEREDFFTEAYSEIMLELFMQWIQTEPHCTKEREYLYHVVMGLGSVKERLVRIETFGFNQETLGLTREAQEEEPGEEIT